MIRKAIQTTEAPLAIGPYSQAISIRQSQTMLYISGQIPIDPHTSAVISGDIIAQTTQVMKNIEAILKAGNLDFVNIVKTTIYLTDLTDFEKVNQVYSQFFLNMEPPARATIQVSKLPKNVSVEIDAIACGE